MSMEWIQAVGYLGVIAIIFIETGFIFGFFLPGDSLLLACGILASKGVFDIRLLAIGLVSAAFLGYSVGYFIGKRSGDWLLKKEDTRWFKKRHLLVAISFYEKHGGKALVLGRLIPLVRSFVPVVAGMSNMSFSVYTFYNFLGAIVWGLFLPLIGYYIGDLLPNIDVMIGAVVAVIIVAMFIPKIVRYIRQRQKVENWCFRSI